MILKLTSSFTVKFRNYSKASMHRGSRTIWIESSDRLKLPLKIKDFFKCYSIRQTSYLNSTGIKLPGILVTKSIYVGAKF